MTPDNTSLSQNSANPPSSPHDDRASDHPQGAEPQRYDFRRPERIAKDQLRAIHLLHDNFARSLAASLSAYLRAYVAVSLIGVEQKSFLEFSQGLPSPTSIVSLGMEPFEGNAILEINPSIVFPILEMLLGGSGKTVYSTEREITEIEHSILEGVFRIILHDLQEAWAPISSIQFTKEAHETEPQLLQILAPSEAIVAVGLSIRLGELCGKLNLGVPSIVVKMLRQKFDQQWSVRRSESKEEEQERMLRLLGPAALKMDARLQGPTLTVENMLNLKIGDVLAFDYQLSQPVDLLVNGCLKFRGGIVTSNRKKSFLISEVCGEE